MPAPLNPQLDQMLTGIAALAAAGQPQPQPQANPGIDALAAAGQPQPNPQLAQAGGLGSIGNALLAVRHIFGGLGSPGNAVTRALATAP
jgi:hypothetical protein